MPRRGLRLPRNSEIVFSNGAREVQSDKRDWDVISRFTLGGKLSSGCKESPSVRAVKGGLFGFAEIQEKVNAR